MQLISMTDFVLINWQNHTETKDACKHNTDSLTQIVNYAKFLNKPLTLGMFIPCDEDGNPLDKPVTPKYFDPQEPVPDHIEEECYNYCQAKEKVLFEGFEVTNPNERISFFKNGHCFLTYSFVTNDFIGNQNIERLAWWDLTLTQLIK